MLMNTRKERHLITKFELERRGLSFTGVARSLGLSHTTVLAVSNSRARSQRVERELARLIDKRPEDIWPEWYQNEKEENIETQKEERTR